MNLLIASRTTTMVLLQSVLIWVIVALIFAKNIHDGVYHVPVMNCTEYRDNGFAPADDNNSAHGQQHTHSHHNRHRRDCDDDDEECTYTECVPYADGRAQIALPAIVISYIIFWIILMCALLFLAFFKIAVASLGRFGNACQRAVCPVAIATKDLILGPSFFDLEGQPRQRQTGMDGARSLENTLKFLFVRIYCAVTCPTVCLITFHCVLINQSTGVTVPAQVWCQLVLTVIGTIHSNIAALRFCRGGSWVLSDLTVAMVTDKE